MAANVGSVITDVIANTVNFEQGMDRAAAKAQATEKRITQQAYNASKAQDVAGKAAQQYAQRTSSLNMTLGNTAVAMAATTGMTDSTGSAIFRLSGYYSMLKMRAAEATAAMAASATAAEVAAAKTKMLAASIATIAWQLAAFMAAMWAASKAWGWVKDWWKATDIAAEKQRELGKATSDAAQKMYDSMTKAKTPIEILRAKLEAGTVSADHYAREVGNIIRAQREMEQSALEAAASLEFFEAGLKNLTEPLADVQNAIANRGRELGFSLVTGEEITEAQIQIEKIEAFYKRLTDAAMGTDLAMAPGTLRAISDARERDLAAAEDRIAQDAWDKAQETAAKQMAAQQSVIDFIEQRGESAGINLFNRKTISDAEKGIAAIKRAWDKASADIANIQDPIARAALAAQAEAAEQTELADYKKSLDDAQHKTRMEQIREQAAAIAAMMTRSAGMVTGFGREMYQAIQQTAQSQRESQIRERLVSEGGASALDDEDKENLRQVRDYLMQLVQVEAVSI